MTETEFQDLCRDISQTLQLSDLDALYRQGQVALDGVEIALFFDADIAPDTLLCYVDLGKVNPYNRMETYQSLLGLNLLTGSKTSGVYSLDPASGNAIFIVHFPHPERLDGKALARLLRGYAEQALAMRGGLLVHEEPARYGVGEPAASYRIDRTAGERVPDLADLV